MTNLFYIRVWGWWLSCLFCVFYYLFMSYNSLLKAIHVVEKAMAPHSSTLAWKIPWTEEPGRLQSMGSLRVGPDWATSLSLLTFMHGRRKWQPTPVFLPRESQGWQGLVGCRLWGGTELDMTEELSSIRIVADSWHGAKYFSNLEMSTSFLLLDL